MYFAAQPMPAAAAAASVIEVEIEVFYGSEEALRTETRTVCALRRSQGRDPLDIGILVSGCVASACIIVAYKHAFSWQVSQAAASPGHEYTTRNDISSKITVWLPRRPRAEQVQVTFPAVALESHQRVIGDSPLPHALDQASLRSMDAPIEAYTVSLLSHGNARIKAHCAESVYPWEV